MAAAVVLPETRLTMAERAYREIKHRILENVFPAGTIMLEQELAGPIHALALHTLTPDEWRQREGRTEASPACRGGSKHDPEFGQ